MLFFFSKSEVIRATHCCNLQHNIVALQVEKCCCTYITTHLKHCHATKFRCCKLLASTFFDKFLQLATTKFCCVTMFEVGGNTCNNGFQLATCKLKKYVARITCLKCNKKVGVQPIRDSKVYVSSVGPCFSLTKVLRSKSVSAVHQLPFYRFVSEHCLRSTLKCNKECNLYCKLFNSLVSFFCSFSGCISHKSQENN